MAAPAVGPVVLQYEEGQSVPRPADLKRLATRVAKGEGLRGAVEIAFCGDATVRALNKRHRKLDKVTDVLSFEWNEPEFAGEVYIAVPHAKDQAPRFNNNFFNELRRLVVHGMLHLCGHDHMKAGERLRMRALEDRYLALAPVTPGKAAKTKKKPAGKPSRPASAPKRRKTAQKTPKKPKNRD